MTENRYQASVIRKLENIFPGCLLLKNDSGYQQGIPDWIILFGRKWAALEIKASLWSRHQPNQEFFIEKMNQMSFAAFIYPDNEEEVLNELQQALKPRRRTRVS